METKFSDTCGYAYILLMHIMQATSVAGQTNSRCESAIVGGRQRDRCRHPLTDDDASIYGAWHRQCTPCPRQEMRNEVEKNGVKLHMDTLRYTSQHINNICIHSSNRTCPRTRRPRALGLFKAARSI